MQVAIYIRVYVIIDALGFLHIGDSRFSSVKRRRLALYTRAFAMGHDGNHHLSQRRSSATLHLRHLYLNT